MKKITAILTALALLSCSLVACGSGDDDNDTKSSKKTSSSQAEEPTEPADSEPAHHKAMNRFFEAVSNKNIEDCTKFIVPQAVLNAMSESELDAAHQDVSDLIELLHKSYEDENGQNVHFRIVEFITEKPLTDGQMTGAEEYFYDFYDDLKPDDSIELDLTEGYEINFTLEISGDDKTSTEILKMCLIKIDKDGWKIYMDEASSLDFEPDDQEPTTEQSATEPVVTTEPATAEPTTAALDNASDQSALYGLDFISFAFGLRPLDIGNEKLCTEASSMLPNSIYDDLADKMKTTDYNQAISPYILDMYNAVAASDSGTYPDVEEVTDIKQLTSEDIKSVNGYYNSIIAKYGLACGPAKIVSGYEAKVTIKCDTSKTFDMICVTDSAGDTAVIPCAVTDIDKMAY